ncbi:sugar kinase [Pedobacter antarcticus]|uniref:sugar kinase n=1 Tax=Pedobacter antarcticus TaxID=34086 RepID=UPI000883A672|nr:sugar kinase [Pedobacter antarcticus]SDM73757.1 2-dehydro-3-deoxygluconokinase [Pedobacter antarcticus]
MVNILNMIEFDPAGKGVLCFGELLLRMSPDAGGAWLNTHQLPCFLGGAELNVATALSLWEIPVTYFTALPDNILAEQLKNSIAGKGIGTDKILARGERVGIYYLPQGTDVKNAGVIYDRANSSFATLQPGTIDWSAVFKGVSWFHFSAICPAVSASAAEVCLEALKYASANGIFISLDLNYRAKLWQYGKQPADIMPGLAAYCDLIMGNIWAAERMLAIPIPLDFQDKTKAEYLSQAELSSREIRRQFPKCKVIANTFRFDAGEKGVKYFTSLHTANGFYHSATYQTEEIVDKVGSGDCFMAGLIYSINQQKPAQESLDFATAAAFNKLFIASDATSTRAADIYDSILPHEKK